MQAILVGILALFLWSCESAGRWHSGADVNSIQDVKRWGVCDHSKHLSPENRQCREWIGEFWGAEDLAETCSKISNGSFSKSPCSQNKLVGVCITDAGLKSEIRYFYYLDDWDAVSGQANCAEKDLASRGLGDTVAEWFLNE